MHKLILLRHGESTWNKENRFTGWTDVDLSGKGIQEAHKAGEYLKKENVKFDIAFTSRLRRAIMTLNIVQDVMDLMWVPVVRGWELNERHYGALQGLNKSEMVVKYGEAQVKIWRRSYNVRPPALELIDERHPSKEEKYRDLKPEQLPACECLADTVKRTIPYYESKIVPCLKNNQTVMIAAHGNSLRALVKYLDNIADDVITELNIPTGLPLIYELDDNLKVIKSYYLGDAEEVKKAMEAVANQGKAK